MSHRSRLVPRIAGSITIVATVACGCAGASRKAAAPPATVETRTSPETPDLIALTSPPARPLLPDNAWPLTLGRERARQLVDDVLDGRTVVTVPDDQLVYIGNGVTAYPKDLANTTITINWRMIAQELNAAIAQDPTSAPAP